MNSEKGPTSVSGSCAKPWLSTGTLRTSTPYTLLVKASQCLS